MKNEKRKTPTNRYYELKQKIKKNDCPVYNCCSCLPYIYFFLRSWAGVGEVNNMTKEACVCIKHIY